MMKDINLTWKADGIIDSYTIYRAEDESLDINTLPPPLIVGVTVKGYTDNYVGDATSLHYRVASVKGDRSKISGEYIVEIGENAIPPNEMYFTTTEGSFSYTSNEGDQILLSDGTIVDIPTTSQTYSFNVPAGTHKVKLVESVDRDNSVIISGEALVELHNFSTLSTVTHFSFYVGESPSSYNLTKVPNYLPSNITDISYMFCNAISFNQDISMWDVSNVTNMSAMFESTTSFNQPLNDWNVSNVIDMYKMFWNASSFNQDLSMWCVSQIPSIPYEFDFDASSWTQPRPVWGTCPRDENLT